jgi:hypothetical protein
MQSLPVLLILGGSTLWLNQGTSTHDPVIRAETVTVDTTVTTETAQIRLVAQVYGIDAVVERSGVSYDGSPDVILYQDAALDLSIARDGEAILTRTYSKHDLIDAEEMEFLSQATLQRVWFDGVESHTGELSLMVMVGMPDTGVVELVRILVDMETGVERILLLDDDYDDV